MRKGEREIHVDSMGLLFARIMTISTIIGVVLMVIPSIIYFIGQNQYVPLTEAYKYWDKPTVQFWSHVKGIHIHGYDWVFSNLQYSDCQSMIGVLLLMITPLLSMFAAILKAPKVFKLLLGLAAVEFIISMMVKGA